MYRKLFFTLILFPVCLSQTCSYQGQLIAEGRSCNLFYICQLDNCGVLNPIMKTCSETSVFDPVNLMCTYNKSACQLVQQNPPTCTCGDTKIPDPTDISYYYTCLPEANYYFYYKRIPCPTGIKFNATIGICNIFDINYVPPDSCGAPNLYPIINDGTCISAGKCINTPLYYNSNCTEQGTFPDALESYRSWHCEIDPCTGKLRKYYYICNAFRNFDPIKLRCTNDESIHLCSAVKNKFNCVSEGTFADPECPSQYYACTLAPRFSYYARRTKCKYADVFDPKTLGCTNPSSINSEKSCESSSDSKRSKHRKNDSSKSSKSSSESSYYQLSDSEDEIGHNNKENCGGLKGKYKVKGQGNQFYTCQGDDIVKMSCKEGYLFDSLRKQCRPRKLVKDCSTCQNSITNNVNLNINNERFN